jgi:hypothetical protein
VVLRVAEALGANWNNKRTIPNIEGRGIESVSVDRVKDNKSQ